jgi:putative membrane protein
MRDALVTLLLLAACTPDAEQHAHPRRSSGRAPSPVLAMQDRDFLEKAAEGSNAEIEIGKLAGARAFRPEVRSFGERMITDHGAMKGELTALARSRRIVLPTSLGDHQAGYDRLVDLRWDRFDDEFVQVMIEDHHVARELFRNAAGGAADPELKAFAAKWLPVIDGHLDHATSLRTGPKPAPAQ